MTKKNTLKINAPAHCDLSWKLSARVALLASVGLCLSGCSLFKTSDDIPDMNLANQLLKKVEERELKIAERDKAIDNLQQRVKQLEQNRVAAVSATTAPPQAVAAASPIKPTAVAISPKPRAAPGGLEIDEEAAQRALERTLVQTGALLLPVGQAEIQPYAMYSRRKTDTVIGVPVTGGNTLIGNDRIRRNDVDAGLNILVGLPFESQAEIRIPTKVVNQSEVLSAQGAFPQEASRTAASFGDISVGLAKTLTHEKGWIPDIIARMTWDTNSGNMTRNNLAMGGGFNDFIASLTFLKRQDPLAFTGRVAYQTTLKKNDIEPGDQYSVSLGVTLAASPQTSLSMGLQQTFSQETKVNNTVIPGSDAVSSVFTVGVSSTIGRSLFCSVSGGIGLTESAPDYFINVTIPFRFDVPYDSIFSKKPVSPLV